VRSADSIEILNLLVIENKGYTIALDLILDSLVLFPERENFTDQNRKGVSKQSIARKNEIVIIGKSELLFQLKLDSKTHKRTSIQKMK
jgi:hypothetical protein